MDGQGNNSSRGDGGRRSLQLIWSHSITVSTVACHAINRSSILLETAKIYAPVSLVVEVLSCNQGVEVRFLPGAPMGDWRNWERSSFASFSQEFESLILHQIFLGLV